MGPDPSDRRVREDEVEGACRAYNRVSRAALKNSSRMGVQSNKSTPPAR